MSIEWVDEPLPTGGYTDYLPVLEAICERPGHWAVLRRSKLRTSASAYLAGWLKAAKYAHLPLHDVEVTQRSAGGETIIYGRYSPGKSA